jgi:hypothetical protein
MRLIKIAENDFINSEHIVKITYIPENQNYKTWKDDNGDNQKKPITNKSNMVVVMSNGYSFHLVGLEADNLYNSIKAHSAN